MRLRDYGVTLQAGVLHIPSINGSPVVEYREIHGHPVPYTTTIQRRTLTRDGEEYRDGASDWSTITVRDVLGQLQLSGPVAYWLRNLTTCDLGPTTGRAERAPDSWL